MSVAELSNHALNTSAVVAVVGTGAMGAGIAQVAAAAGHVVKLLDNRPEAAAKAVAAEGFVYLEAPRAWTSAELAPWGLAGHRHLKAGAVHAHLLQRG